MGQLWIVRHGQASLGEANYDQLSALGQAKSERLGEYWRQQGQHFERVLRGSLTRHAQTLEGIATGMRHPLQAQVESALNEYDSEALIETIQPGPRPAPRDAESVRQHFVWLREALTRWIRAEVQPVGMPSHAEFMRGLVATLEAVLAADQGPVLMVSSGGPISMLIAHVLGAPAHSAIELNMRIRNTGLTEMHFKRGRISLASYNTLPHLSGPDHAHWLTYA